MMFEMAFSFLLFLFSFLISYGLLMKVKIFPKTTNAIISVVIAFYFLSASVFYSENIIQLLAYSFLVLFVALIVISVLKARKEVHKSFSDKSK